MGKQNFKKKKKQILKKLRKGKQGNSEICTVTQVLNLLKNDKKNSNGLRQGKRIQTWFDIMAKKAEKAKTIFVNATDILQKETNNGTSCDSAKEALTLLKNCSNSSAEACDSGEIGITK